MLLAGCTPTSTYTPDSATVYTAPAYTPTIQTSVPVKKINPVDSDGLVIYQSFSKMGEAVVHDMLNTPELMRYLKHNKKAWITVKYDRTVLFNMARRVFFKDHPAKHDPKLTDFKWIGSGNGYVKQSYFVGFRALIEFNLINAGFKRVVVGSDATRQLLSGERMFQLRHARTKTIHSPGHVEGSSLIVLLTPYQRMHPPREYGWDKETGQAIGLGNRDFDEQYPFNLKVSVVRVKDDQMFFSKIYSVKSHFNDDH